MNRGELEPAAGGETACNKVNILPLEAGAKAGSAGGRKKEWKEGMRVVLDAVEKAV